MINWLKSDNGVLSIIISLMVFITLFCCNIKLQEANRFLIHKNYYNININNRIFIASFTADSGSSTHIQGYIINAYCKLYTIDTIRTNQ